MQRGLVDNGIDDRGAVGLPGEPDAVKPGIPSAIEVSVQPDFVPSDLVAIGS